MARILLHTLVFSPDAVSTAYLMTDLARQLHGNGNSVVVLTTTPHYNLDRASLSRQPLERRWFGLLYRSSCNGISVWHVSLPMKGKRVYSRVLDYVYFHVVSVVVGMLALRDFDIVITPSPPLTIGLVGWLLGRFRRVPMVYNVQEIYPDFAVNQGLIRNPLVIRFLKRVERWVYSRSTRVVTISEWFSRIIVDRVDSAAKLMVIPNFVDLELYRPLSRKNTFAEQHDLIDSFVVLYGGNIGLSQDWESLLRAASELQSHPIVFVIVGDGARREWLQREIIVRGRSNIRLMDYHSREKMAEINATSDVCIIPMKPETTRDTFPSKIYTILACGKPVIVQADQDSELEWLVTSVGCGIVVKPGDPEGFTKAILDAYRNRDKLDEQGRRGREFVVREYSKEAVARRYRELIESLVNGKARH